MDGNDFDELTRSLATNRSRRSVLRGLAGGAAALVAMRAGSSRAASKVAICHYPPGNPANVHVISVSANAVAAHVANHGDTVLGTIDSCTDCGDVCAAVDACTPAECTDDGCNAASKCISPETCGGGGVSGACGCTSDCSAATCADLSNGCGGTCPVADQGARSVSVSYSPSGDPNYCSVTVSLSGFAGCHQFAGTYTAFEGSSHNQPNPSPGCGPTGTTEMDGSVVQGSCSYVKDSLASSGGSCVQIVIDGVSSGCPPVAC